MSETGILPPEFGAGAQEKPVDLSLYPDEIRTELLGRLAPSVRETMGLVASGFSNLQISERVGRSLGAVERLVSDAYVRVIVNI